MANIPLIPGAQQTYSRFKRRGKNTPVDFDEHLKEKQPKRSFKRRLEERRKLSLKTRLERRSDHDRRNQVNKNSSPDSKRNLSGKGRHINTTA